MEAGAPRRIAREFGFGEILASTLFLSASLGIGSFFPDWECSSGGRAIFELGDLIAEERSPFVFEAR